jgi:hypothetical protein
MCLGVLGSFGLALAGCLPVTNWEVLHREVGHTVAEVTLVAGQPLSHFDAADGLRGFRWERSHLAPRGGKRCLYTLYARREGRARSLAAWRVVGSALPPEGCGPLVVAKAAVKAPVLKGPVFKP